MLLTLHISKIEPGNYRVLVLEGREELDQCGARQYIRGRRVTCEENK